MDQVQISGVGQLFGNAAPSLQQRLLESDFDADILRPCVGIHANAVLNDGEWGRLDAATMPAFEQALVGVADLRNLGLVENLGGMGVILTEYARAGSMNGAEISMWASIDAEQDRMMFDLQEVPIPCIFKEFQLDLRFVRRARLLGTPIDTLQAVEAGRVVGEKLEDLLFNGNTTVYGGKPIYGYRTHPDRNTASGSSWATVTNIFPNVLTMFGSLMADEMPGPYGLYVNHAEYIKLHAIVEATGQLTAMQQILRNVEDIAFVRRTKHMPAGQAVLVALNSSTVDLAVAEDLAPYEWESRGGITSHYRAMMFAAPRIKSAKDGKCGIYHITGIA
jgi:uncharacterized linocin/CFP29 family protein